MGEVALLAFPVVLQTIAETVMQLCSAAMVGRLGAAQLGAVGFAGIWIWTLFVPFAGTANGVQSFVSRHDGAGESARCGAWVWQAIWRTRARERDLGLYDRLVSAAAVRVDRTAARDVRSGGELRRARLLGAPFIAANFAMIAFFRGCGDTRTPMRAALIAIVVNIVIAWVLDLRRARRAAARRGGRRRRRSAPAASP